MHIRKINIKSEELEELVLIIEYLKKYHVCIQFLIRVIKSTLESTITVTNECIE